MNDMKFNCPYCDQHLEAPGEMAGQTVPCPACKSNIEIPGEPQMDANAIETEPEPPPPSVPSRMKGVMTPRNCAAGAIVSLLVLAGIVGIVVWGRRAESTSSTASSPTSSPTSSAEQTATPEERKEVPQKAPTVIAVWRHRYSSGSGEMKLYSNGKINSPTGAATWTLDGRKLVLRWPNENAPGGAWVDHCIVSVDGKSYAGRNQNAIRVGGTLLSGKMDLSLSSDEGATTAPLITSKAKAGAVEVSRQASPKQAKAERPRQDEGWRTSMEAFAKEVIAVAKSSKITDASFAITRIREYTVFNNAEGEKTWVVFKQGFDNELHGEFVKRFSGVITWKGTVESTETDAKNNVQVIEVEFPAPKDPPHGIEFRDGVRLSIPITKLPTAKLPAKGRQFSFRGTLRKEKDDALFEPVWVFYGLGPNAGKLLVGVNLEDVEPMESK